LPPAKPRRRFCPALLRGSRFSWVTRGG
jgi:hypothetical protein